MIHAFIVGWVLAGFPQASADYAGGLAVYPTEVSCNEVAAKWFAVGAKGAHCYKISGIVSRDGSAKGTFPQGVPDSKMIEILEQAMSPADGAKK